jgi:hypothetical protein
MTSTLTTSQLQNTLTFPFRQPNGATKLAVAAGLALASLVVPLVPMLFVAGYQKAVARAAIDTGELTMPEWDNWSGYLTDGLKVFGAGLLLMLPAILLFSVGLGGMLVTSVGAAIAEEGGQAQQVAWTLPLLLGSFAGIGLFGVGALLLMAASLIYPIATAHLIATDDFGAAFRFREWLPILRANLGGFALAYLVVMGVGFLMSVVVQILQLTLVLCCLVPAVFAVYAAYTGILSSALFGLAYRDGRQKLADAQVPAPSGSA